MTEESRLLQKYASVLPHLNERQRRLVAAADAQMLGYGGMARVARAAGLNRSTLHRGLQDLAGPVLPAERVRHAGGGRTRVSAQPPAIVQELERLVDPVTRGDPQSPLRWTCKSTRQLARTLTARGYAVSYRVVGELLRELGYSLQANAKTLEGASHPDRKAQFEYLNAQVQTYLAKRWPVISVDAKKKELVGQSHKGGQEWQPQGQPEKVNVHDLPDPQLGKALPYGSYEVGRNLGWVNVGGDPDTASFAVESIRRWWTHLGSDLYKKAKQLLICAESGGRNGYRVRLWKVELQELADTLDVAVTVCQLPPGTSKWNKIEQRLFSHIRLNWRGRPTAVNTFG
jgi:DNA-binding phage protein